MSMVLSIESQEASSESGSERRRGLRIPQNRPVKVYEPSACRYIAGHTEDVSATGLRIMLPRSAPLRPGSVLAVHVGLNEFGQPLVNRRQMMAARVIWVDRHGDQTGPLISAGVEWTASIAAHRDAA